MNKLIVTLIRQEKLESLVTALKTEQIDFTYHSVKGFCKEVRLYREDIHDRIKVEIVVEDKDVEQVKDIILTNACCGLEGDGCLSVYVVEEYMKFS